MDDDDDDTQDVMLQGAAAPIVGGDDSYQQEPVAEFENSQSDAMLAFKQGMRHFGNSSSTGAAQNMQQEEQSRGPTGGLFSAWAEASASKGVRPLDFSFLMPPPTPAVAGGVTAATIASNTSVATAQDDDDEDLPDEERKVVKRSRAVLAEDSRTGRSWGEENNNSHFSNSNAPFLVAPKAPVRPSKRFFGQVPNEDRGEDAMDPPIQRMDPYAWMRCSGDEVSSEVKALLEEENRYADASTQHLSKLSETLYHEMLGHQRETDDSLLTEYAGGYAYFSRHIAGKSYQLHFRRKREQDGSWGEEELVLDENEIAIDEETGEKRPYCSVSGPEPSADHRLYIYGTDFAGNDSYTLQLLQRGGSSSSSSGNSNSKNNGDFELDRPMSESLLTDAFMEIESTDGSVIWSPDCKSFFYLELDSEFRAFRLRQHILGKDPTGEDDPCLFEERDRKFSVGMSQTSCSRFLVLTSCSAQTSEDYLLDLGTGCTARGPASAADLIRVSKREFKHSYSVDHRDGVLYILTNKDGYKDSKLCRTMLALLPDSPAKDWEDVWTPPEGTQLQNLCCFKDFLALTGREHGQCRIYVHSYQEPNSPPSHAIEFPDALSTGTVHTPRGAQASVAAFSAGLDQNRLFDTKVLRYNFSSFVEPGLVYEYDVHSREHRLLRTTVVPNFDSEKYRAERITTSQRKVPISLVFRLDIHPAGLAGGPFPLLLTGYGAYGCCQDPDFDGNCLSLLDRGVIYAVVHVRGGGELGEQWHEEGKGLQVKNRFADFVEAAETLVSLRVTAPDRLAAWGTSSGGLLVTASMNLRPDLFRAVLLEVPFCDALNTMSDPTIPLTCGEWEEVGNPNERTQFYYMLEYSPYDNLQMQAYPAAFVTASLHDAMVGYWEPLKFVSKLRALKLDERPVLLRTNFHAGHGASSDRYENTKEAALHFAFLLDQLGLRSAPLLPVRMIW
eukprot:CAMPEP_0206431540 /NCGR_PEP_ID=MMETSP0324_2-20121206/7423_1 /ASSEMBLY_ACC=CAM_ASM_000836 /TAXON_ID=2866 /ORGANISM="Crypthecodinium cohnii, Strain Seligo" /LENGTH=951 /DNA_ID=CAMNT_0053897483 /DNA_START=139 /DNA_END=2991 /DNA_ORIENTATION=-